MRRTTPARTSSKRTHTLGGCDTCRRRHIKCDRLRPACLNCQAIAAVCTGYNSELVWMNTSEGATIPDTIRDVRQGRPARNHLFTEESRVSMCTTLQSDLASKSVNKSISELDVRSKDKSSTNQQNISVGPFSVFALPAENITLHTDVSGQDEDFTPLGEGNTDLVASSTGSFESPNDLHDWLDWQDLFNLDYQFPTMEADEIEFTSTLEPHPHVEQFDVNSSVLESQGCKLPHEFSESASWPKALKLADAEILLNHFKCHVVPQLISIPLGRKSVWDVTVVTSAMLTLAKVTYMTSDHVSKAELANLLAICATSAIHLSAQHEKEGKDTAQYWTEFAAQSIHQARQSLQWSLQHETKGPKSAKYKDQLMATFAVTNHSTLYDYQAETRANVLEAERLLRFRGLAKPYISRKARLLHHLYSWIRIVGESTYVLHDYKKDRRYDFSRIPQNTGKRRRGEGVMKDVKHPERTDEQNTRLDDFLRLQSNAADVEAVTFSGEGAEAGIRDIHYEISLERRGTLYMQLYGISENWLSLVSQITRLANVLDSFKISKDRNIEMFESMERRKMRLEQMVCSFAMADPSAHQIWNSNHQNESSIDEEATIYAELRSHMIKAFNSSLMIFFYRRIRDVSPWILQEHVDKVIRALEEFKTVSTRHNMTGPGSPWPSFIAGCESMTNTQREYFETWFDSAFELTSFKRFQTAKQCMTEVWARRDAPQRNRVNTRDLVYSWVSLLQERKVHVMLA